MAKSVFILQKVTDSRRSFFETDSGKKVAIDFPSEAEAQAFVAEHKLSPDETAIWELAAADAGAWIVEAKSRGAAGLVHGLLFPGGWFNDRDVVPFDFLHFILQ